ncbi:hypothetical protein Micbo1qcDRAFT_193315 [Microdochium bolleyi]|uniref:Zn(2)-C6 fungal-type domain-containing protein n=1 Tax=Microdochium bolleyi TaxID=196109 RepID=A0A136JA29_9PEZI|nr:hypothetical protein Micbo1qcDRAFT_193315 [Microdochium bolleyi]
MPRPKVRPEDRQRSLRACSACKSSKIRCNSELPCSACVKRGRASACVYSDVDRRRRNRPGLVSHAQKHQQLPIGKPHPSDGNANDHSRSNSSAEAGSGSGGGGGHHIHFQASPAITSASGDPDADQSPLARSPSPSVNDDVSAPLPKDQLLISSQGEKVYIGETASLSFLYFLRKTLRPFVGRTRFTDGETHNIMHEWETGHVESDHIEASAEQMYLLLESYFEATSGLFDLFTADEIDTLVSERVKTFSNTPHSMPSEGFSPFTAKSKRDDLAALDVALAIGAQTQPPGSTIIDAQTQAAFFSRARQIAFEGMIANPSLSMVRLFLLMAFYMLGACHRNAASMYLGVASKAAVVLGLSYIRKHRNAQLEDYDSRLRVWNSLVVLDTLMSFILGRPQSLPPTRSEASRAGTPAPESAQGTFPAIVRGCALIENIVQTLRSSNMLHVPTAENLLEQLRLWTQSLPEAVRQFTFTASAYPGSGFSLESADRQALVGNVHVSCVYYFAVILITRPFLIADHMPRLRARASQHGSMGPGGASVAATPTPESKVRNAKVAKLAQVCVSSAMFMAETLQKLKKSDFAFGNLCLVKAWIFGSGLVLGFSMFAGEPRQDISDAFVGARDVLESIAERSPQAKNYHEILTTMGEAVVQYRRRESLEARRNVQHYMSQILVVDVAGGGSSSQAPDDIAAATLGAGGGDSRYLMQSSSLVPGGGDLYQQQQATLNLAGYSDGGDFLRSQQRQQQQAGSGGMAKQCMSPFSAHDLVTPTSDPSVANFGSSSTNGAAMSMYGGGGGAGPGGHMTDSILDDLQIDWGDLDLQLGDDSGLFDSGPFETLFYSIE